MTRANRIHAPGLVWHLTHRCHRRRFLLKFARDRLAWRNRLFEAKQRFNLCVLNYTVTSNHVHLIVRDRDQGEIAASMQYLEGCAAQDFNRRKARSGAFWSDRYHATAVATDAHLARCIVYVDLNMVRAGAVSHPAEWAYGGYHEIQGSRKRYTIVDRAALAALLDLDLADLAPTHREWVEVALRERRTSREAYWSESVAVGGRGFLERVQESLGHRGRHRQIEQSDDTLFLREPPTPYGLTFVAENAS